MDSSPPQAMDSLAMSAAKLRASLGKSQAITNTMVHTLSSFDNHLSALQDCVRPTQVHTDDLRMAEQNIKKTLNSIEGILKKFSLIHQIESQIEKEPRENIRGYFEAIDQLRSVKAFFTPNNSFKSNEVINRINNVFEKAIQKLEKEFKSLLTAHSLSHTLDPPELFNCLPNSLQSSSGSSENQGDNGAKNLESAAYRLSTVIPPHVLLQLRDITTQFAQVERSQQCLRLYRGIRSLALENRLKSLGVENLGEDDLQKMEWDVLQDKIRNWTQYMRIAVKVLFVAEQKVSDQIFDDIHYIKDQCFAQVTSKSMGVLINFGAVIAKSQRSPEKLFVLLDMYEVMWELQVEVETIFSDEACSKIRDSARGLTKCLAQAACETFDTFEESVASDATKTTCFGGEVHPLTRYVVNYVNFLFEYKSTFEQLLQNSKSRSKENFQLEHVTVRIMEALDCNLDMKSKQYSDPALASFFLMNNIHYMWKHVSRRLDQKDVTQIGIRKTAVQNRASNHLKVAWTKIADNLCIKGLTVRIGDDKADQSDGYKLIVPKNTVKNRFKYFTTQFDELHRRISQWVIPDIELREAVKISISDILLPSYQTFYTHIGSKLKPKELNHYAKYTPEDIKKKLEDLFNGKSASQQNK